MPAGRPNQCGAGELTQVKNRPWHDRQAGTNHDTPRSLSHDPFSLHLPPAADQSRPGVARPIHRCRTGRAGRHGAGADPGRGRAAPGDPRPQQPARCARSQCADAPAAPVQQPAAVRADGGRHRHRFHGPLGGHGRDCRRGGAECGDRVCAGRQGRGGAASHPPPAQPARGGAARWPPHRPGCRPPGARRCGAAGLGRPSARRCAPARCPQPAGGRSRPHRRIGAGGQAHPGRGRRCPAGRPSGHGLCGHAGDAGAGAGRGGGHGRAHRDGPHRPHAVRGGRGHHPAAAQDGGRGPQPDRGHPGGRHLAVRFWRVGAGHASGRDVHGRCGPGGGRHSRGAARHHDHCAGHRRAAHGQAACRHPPPASGGNTGLGHRDLLRQNRHPHPQRDDGAASGAGRLAVECGRRGLCPRGPHRARRRTSRGCCSHHHRHRRHHHRARGIQGVGPGRRAVQRRAPGPHPGGRQKRLGAGGRPHRRRVAHPGHEGRAQPRPVPPGPAPAGCGAV